MKTIFKLTIECDNAAFQGGPLDRTMDDYFRNREIASVLKDVAQRLTQYERDTRASGPCMDSNGNKVGVWRISGVRERKVRQK